MTKEVAKKQSTEVAEPIVSSGAFSATVDANDIIIPKVLLMQSISTLVEAEKAKSGDFIHSLDEVVLGKKEEKPVEFIVLGMYKTIHVYEGKKYIKTIDFTPNKPWSEVVNGVEIFHKPTSNYYVILNKDIENMAVFPHVITFKGNSHKNSKKLNTKLMMLEEFGAEIYAKSFNLVAKSEENDQGKFYVMDVIDGKKTTEIEVKQALKWVERLKTVNVQVHDNDADESTESAAPVIASEDIPF